MTGEVPRLAHLELIPRTRPGGDGRTEQSFLDFVIDGVSLFDVLTDSGHDVISPLGWGLDQEQIRKRLLLDSRPLIDRRREPIMVCPECGDLGCGAVTAEITAEGGVVTWRNFGWETNYDDDGPDTSEYRDLGPFQFDAMAIGRLFLMGDAVDLGLPSWDGQPAMGQERALAGSTGEGTKRARGAQKGNESGPLRAIHACWRTV